MAQYTLVTAIQNPAMCRRGNVEQENGIYAIHSSACCAESSAEYSALSLKVELQISDYDCT